MPMGREAQFDAEATPASPSLFGPVSVASVR